MATTDTRPGFRLPWSTNGADTEESGSEPTDAAGAVEADAEAQPVTDLPATDAPQGVATPTEPAEAAPTEVESAMTPDEPVVAEAEPVAPAAPAAPEMTAAAVSKKPNKFLADLTRAMRATAEASRNETMERFAADAKAATERVHAAAADEATELRRGADDDVAGIREWSKGEIARIREETENRISGRKADLEHELEVHAGTVEVRIERVNARVTAFEAEVESFYERLFAEDDPTRFAAMAEQLPEPPSLELDQLDADAAAVAKATPVATPDEVVVEASEPEMTAETAPEAEDAPADAFAEAEAEAQPAAVAETTPEAPMAEPTESTETGVDPRVAALDLTPDFAAAEAEAAAPAAGGDAAPAVDDIPTIADEVLAARLAGLVPEENTSSNPIQTTKVVVTGLVSVASIAGYKRHLGRLQGVTTVGVSSGPDGEFVFSVHHLSTVDLAAGIAGIPGFESKITSQSDGAIEVVARDPEAHD